MARINTTPDPGFGPSQESAATRFLDRLRARHGRGRVNILLVWMLMTLCALMLIALVTWYMRQWAMRLVEPEVAASIGNAVIGVNALLTLLISAACLYALMRGVVRPVQTYHERMQEKITSDSSTAQSQIAALERSHKMRVQQLQAALADNKTFRDRITDMEGLHECSNILNHAVIESTTDYIAVVGADGHIAEISGPLSNIAGVHFSRAVGRKFDEVLKLYDSHHDDPTEYPIRDAAAQAIQAASSVPKITRVMMATERGGFSHFLMTVSVVKGRDSNLIAVLFHFEPENSPPPRAAAAVPSVVIEKSTGLADRASFDRRLKELIDTARTRGLEHALLMIECDNLRRIKNSLGHAAAAELFWNVTRIARLGTGSSRGAECFLASSESIGILMSNASLQEARKLAEQIHHDISSASFAWQEARFESTVSIGIVQITRLTEGASTLLDTINHAVVCARSDGGGRSHVHVDGQETVTRRLGDQEWISWLLPRLKNGNGHIISQSILPLGGASALQPMFEVFVRVQDDDGTWLPPGSFMPAIERHELGALLDQWVLETLLKELGSQPILLAQNACASINLCAASLEDPQFGRSAREAIFLSGIPGEKICFEIREDLAMSHMSAMMRFAAEVKAIGCRIALDRYKDMGGLRALKDVPIDFIKVHESLVRGTYGEAANKLDRMRLGWLRDFCAASSVGMIATGIDNDSAVATLREMNIAYAQGTALNKLGPVMA